MMRFDAPSGKLKTGARPGLVRTQPATPPAGSGQAQPHQGSGLHSQAATAVKHQRSFKRGSLIFIEGDTTTEMFIIKTGKVKVLKQEGAKTIELAVLGPGSVLGEMSLLLAMPRSATAQVIEDCTALAIDRTVLEDTYTKIPSWLVSVIEMVVKRLRDTLYKNSENLISDNMGGVVNLLLLLAENYLSESSGSVAIPLELIKEEALYTVGISGSDVDKILTELILKELIVIGKSSKGRDMVVIKKHDILNLFFEYLLAHYNGKTLPGETLSEGACAFARVLVAAGRERGGRAGNGSCTLTKPVIEVALEKAGQGRHINLDYVDELKNNGLIDVDEKTTATAHLSHTQISISFTEKKLEKALLTREWLVAFADDEQK